MAVNQDVQSIEETLNKTDFGHVVNENKVAILISAAVVVLGIIVYSVFAYMQKSERLDILDQAYALETSVFEPFLKDELAPLEYKKKLGDISNDLRGNINLVPSFLAGLNKLDQAGKLDSAMKDMTADWFAKMNQGSLGRLFLGLRLSAIYEDSGEVEKAITLLENFANDSNLSLMQDKVHFDLVRLSVQMKDTKKAKQYFEKLKSDHQGSQFFKYAKVYMSGLL